MADTNLQTLHSFLGKDETKLSSGGQLISYSHDHGSGPVLVLVHGYPQSSFIWRHAIPLLKDKISLFIPELPGYGFSALPPKSDKRTVGNLIIEAAQAVFGASRAFIWCGHDRGGRIGHRLLVDNDPKHNIKAAILMDIVPTTEQWRSFSDPRAAIGYFHWPFLASPRAPQMIELMGGRNYILTIFEGIKGGNQKGVARLSENDAIEHYAHQFHSSECIAGSCADYAAAGTVDVAEQAKDQEAGRKIEAPTLVLYSEGNLGRVHDVSKLWKNWANGEIECIGIGEGYGHFLPEEAPEETVKLIVEWIDKHGK